jgi:hypothetical protein
MRDPRPPATEKFHWNRIPAHLDSVRIGCFRELLFGTAPESAAPARRRRGLRQAGVEPNAGQKIHSPVFSGLNLSRKSVLHAARPYFGPDADSGEADHSFRTDGDHCSE